MTRHECFDFLPASVDLLRVVSDKDGPVATIDLIWSAMHLAGDAAKGRGIDPGRPSVAEFGRRLYRGGVSISSKRRQSGWIAKKRRALFLGPQSNLSELRTALTRFLDRLRLTRLKGIVLDYDGTLVSRRIDGAANSVIAKELNRLVGEGVYLGVATGRGRSAHAELRKALDPAYWNNVIVGMYNGSCILRLADPLPDKVGVVMPGIGNSIRAPQTARGTSRF